MDCNIDCSRAFECHHALTRFNGLVKEIHDPLIKGDINSAIRACDVLRDEINKINKVVTER